MTRRVKGELIALEYPDDPVAIEQEGQTFGIETPAAVRARFRTERTKVDITVFADGSVQAEVRRGDGCR